MQLDDLDNVLDQSAPSPRVTPRQHELLVAMLEQSAPRRRRLTRVTAAAAAVAVLLSGGAAVAWGAGLWAPWAQKDPYASIAFRAPSGRQCEFRRGDLQGTSPDVAQVIRDTLAQARFTDQEVLEAARRIGISNALTNDDAYEVALDNAVNFRIDQALAAHGLKAAGSTMSSEAHCS